MASRRQAREFALQALYEADLREAAGGECLGHLWATLVDGDGMEGERPAEAEEVAFAERLCAGVDARRAEIDALIEGCSTNWRVSRMPVVDRNILRLSAYELLACADIPATVSINEAIELGKRFGTADTRAFVNGIVDRLGRKLGRIEAGRAETKA